MLLFRGRFPVSKTIIPDSEEHLLPLQDANPTLSFDGFKLSNRVHTPELRVDESTMNLTGLLLGAGASFDIGMPLVKELHRDLKRYMTPERLRSMNLWQKSRGGGVPDQAIEVLIELLARNDLNYEQIIGNLEVLSHRTKEQEGFSHLQVSMTEWVYLLLLEWHENNKDYVKRNIGLLDGMKEFCRKNSPLWVFSLNQDLIMECFAAHSGIPLSCGFTNEVEVLPLRDESGVEIGDLEAWVLPSEQVGRLAYHFFKTGEEGINLVKIHGSLDVFSIRDGKDFLKLIPTSGGVEGVIDALLIANKNLRPNWPEVTVRAINEIVYADQFGEIQFLRRTPLAGAFKFQEGHSQVIPQQFLTNFEGSLNHLSTLICIGYSFGDYHINDAIRAWLELLGERSLIIVDPHRSQIPDPFLHLAPQVVVVTGKTATDYLDEYSGISRSKSDGLSKILSAWTREAPALRKEALVRFFESEVNRTMDGLGEWLSTLPMRDGDLDLEAMGLTVEEFIELGEKIIQFPTVDDILLRFLTEVKALPD